MNYEDYRERLKTEDLFKVCDYLNISRDGDRRDKFYRILDVVFFSQTWEDMPYFPITTGEDNSTPKKARTDTEINKLYGIPTRTLQDWKNRSKDNWRLKIYETLKNTCPTPEKFKD